MNLEQLITSDVGTIIDVRTPMEYMGGHVADSVNIPLMELPYRMDEIKNLDLPIIFWLRLFISAYLIWQGIQMKDNFALFIGSFFLLQAITNTGCCGAGGCSVPNQKMTNKISDDDHIDYTIVKP